VEWERGFTNMKIGINEIEEIRVWARYGHRVKEVQEKWR
jgi:hypothetical protein